MSLSYKEKGLLGSLVVTLLVFGWYLYGAFAGLSLNPQPPDVSSIVALLIWFCIFEAILRGFLAIGNSAPLEDERDKLIEQVSYGYSYILVCLGIFLLMGQILFVDWFDAPSALSTPNGMFHLLLAVFILAEVTNFGVQLYYQRRGF